MNKIARGGTRFLGLENHHKEIPIKKITLFWIQDVFRIPPKGAGVQHTSQRKIFGMAILKMMRDGVTCGCMTSQVDGAFTRAATAHTRLKSCRVCAYLFARLPACVGFKNTATTATVLSTLQFPASVVLCLAKPPRYLVVARPS